MAKPIKSFMFCYNPRSILVLSFGSHSFTYKKNHLETKTKNQFVVGDNVLCEPCHNNTQDTDIGNDGDDYFVCQAFQ